jgi:long-chain acyl-CoA synthetase
MTWTIAGLVRHYAAERPDQPMLTARDAEGGLTTVRWSDEDARTNRLAQALRQAGVGAGDRVAFLDKNGTAFFDVLFASAKLNAVPVPVNWRLAPPEVSHIVNDAGAKVLIASQEFAPVVEAIVPDLSTVGTIVSADAAHGRSAALDEWIAEYPATDPGVEPEGGDVALQLYTSGTTGLPKGAMLTNDNFAAIIPEFTKELGLTPASVSMAAMPLFHIGGSGWALLGLANGCHTVLVRDVVPAAVLEAIAQCGISHAFLVPAVLQFMLDVPGAGETDFSSLQIISYGASPISESVLRRCLATFGCGFMQVYGMTETTGAISLLRPEEHLPGAPPERLRSCGVPFAGVEIRIIDPDSGEELGPGEVGELRTRSAQNMLGYWHKPEETARTINPDGWLRTGDAGYRDADGFLYLHDRIKDMVVSGGENIYPAEVENVLMSHPAVADAAVIGVPDDRWGETVKAIVVPVPGAEQDADSIIAHCRERLAHFKCPRSVDFVAALPRNPSGKILKRELREPYWAGRERNIS